MTDHSLLHRMDTLERQNRRLRTLLLAVALIGVAAISTAQIAPFPPELRARRLVLVDADGNAMIELRADGPSPSVTLRDGDDVLVELTTDGQRGVIRYLDEQGRTRDLTMPMGPRPITRLPK